MTVVYAREEAPEELVSSIFLIGPTPTQNGVHSWRTDALRLLADAGFEGVVFVPESRPDEFGNTRFRADYTDQIEWERCYLHMADVLLAWVARSEQNPGITTNFELGEFIDSGKLVYGAPADAWKTRYARYWARKLQVPDAVTLGETVTLALQLIGEGASRTGGEREVPLFIWRTPHFQQWYQALRTAGNRLDGARVVWTWRLGAGRKIVFFWILHAMVWIAAEGRHKANEVVLARPDISAIVLYQRAETLDDCRVVLVKEFRTPVHNADGYVWENPGGSSWSETAAPLTIAAQECHEETGLEVEPSRFVRHESRQLVSNLSAHRAHLFSVELTEEEMAWVMSQAGVAYGVVEDTERTYISVARLGDIRAESLVDWSHLGMILQVLAPGDRKE